MNGPASSPPKLAEPNSVSLSRIERRRPRRASSFPARRLRLRPRRRLLISARPSSSSSSPPLLARAPSARGTPSPSLERQLSSRSGAGAFPPALRRRRGNAPLFQFRRAGGDGSIVVSLRGAVFRWHKASGFGPVSGPGAVRQIDLLD